MEAMCPSEKVVAFYQYARLYTQRDKILHGHRYENLSSNETLHLITQRLQGPDSTSRTTKQQEKLPNNVGEAVVSTLQAVKFEGLTRIDEFPAAISKISCCSCLP
jgi:hypothetical protein